MDFIDDEDSPLAHSRWIFDAVPEFTDVIHAIIGCCVNFDDVHEAAFFDGKTVGAFAAWSVGLIQAVDTFGQQPGYSSFTGSPGTTEKIGMVHRAQLDLVFEDFNDVFLPQDLFKDFWSVGTI